MRMKVLSLIAAGILAAGAAYAASPMSVLTTIEKEVVVKDTKGAVKVTRVPAKTVVPGDTVIYTYHLKYVDKSAQTQMAIVTFSVDAGKSFDEAAKLEVTGADGKRHPASPADYTHIRWVLSVPVEGGTTKEVAFRAVLQ
jgi:hypothetical protein